MTDKQYKYLKHYYSEELINQLKYKDDYKLIHNLIGLIQYIRDTENKYVYIANVFTWKSSYITDKQFYYWLSRKRFYGNSFKIYTSTFCENIYLLNEWDIYNNNNKYISVWYNNKNINFYEFLYYIGCHSVMELILYIDRYKHQNKNNRR